MAGTGVEELPRTGVLQPETPQASVLPLGLPCTLSVTWMEAGGAVTDGAEAAWLSAPNHWEWAGGSGTRQQAAYAEAPGAFVDLSAVTQLSEKQMERGCVSGGSVAHLGGSRLRPRRLCRLLAERGASVPALVSKR